MMFEMIAAQCANVIVPEATSAALRYYNSGNLLWIINQTWGFVIPLLFLFTGFSAKLAGFSEKLGRRWFWIISIYLILFIAIMTLLDFPLDYYGEFLRQHAYGLSTQSFGGWINNYWKSVVILMVTAVAFIWIFYLLLRKSPRRWWLYGALVSTGIMFILNVVQPIWIDPLFNHFGPMKNKELEAQILDLAARAGIKGGRIYEVDKSAETKTLNAYVIGFGATKRIVLWDTTIQQMTPDQLLFVMGHEMGHFVLHHMWWAMAYETALTFLVFYLTYRSANFLLARYQDRFGFYYLYDIASIPLFVFLTSFYLLLLAPVSNYFSRALEHHADIFGLEITQNNQAAGEAFLILQKENLANPRPGPIFKIWRSTHPPLGERIDFTNTYCPWVENEELKYSKFFNSRE